MTELPTNSSLSIFLSLYQHAIAPLLFPCFTLTFSYSPRISTELLYWVLFLLEPLFWGVSVSILLLFWRDCVVVPLIFAIFFIALDIFTVLVFSWDDESVYGLILVERWVNFVFCGLGKEGGINWSRQGGLWRKSFRFWRELVAHRGLILSLGHAILCYLHLWSKHGPL